ncbi:MAG: hypothetical protein GEU74_16140 [Nitriliruptorales bacterium]|nr:hypothetical protein [Nitriliruptorales bacterium]
MAEIVAAAAAVLADQGRFVAVTGRDAGRLSPVRDAAVLGVVAPGPTTRLGIAAGVIAGGHRPVVIGDAPLPPVSDAPEILAISDDAALSRQALQAGWTVIQPWSGNDVAPLLSRSRLPALLFLGSHPDETPEGIRPAHPMREWERGELATLVASGPAVGAMLELCHRLRSRGVDIGMLEMATLTRPEMAPLVGGTAVLVSGRGSGAAWRGGGWPNGRVETVPLAGGVDAELMGAVMALVPVT